MKKILLFTILAISLISCNKAELEEENSELKQKLENALATVNSLQTENQQLQDYIAVIENDLRVALNAYYQADAGWGEALALAEAAIANANDLERIIYNATQGYGEFLDLMEGEWYISPSSGHTNQTMNHIMSRFYGYDYNWNDTGVRITWNQDEITHEVYHHIAIWNESHGYHFSITEKGEDYVVFRGRNRDTNETLEGIFYAYQLDNGKYGAKLRLHFITESWWVFDMERYNDGNTFGSSYFAN